MKSFRHHKSHLRRGAVLTMELVLVLPIFLLLLFAIVEFSMLTSARLRIADAARSGVRSICLSNASDESIRTDIRNILGPKLAENIRIDVAIPRQTGALANVRVTIPMSNAAPDLLWMTGFSVRDRVLIADAPMVREHDLVSSDHSDSEQF